MKNSNNATASASPLRPPAPPQNGLAKPDPLCLHTVTPITSKSVNGYYSPSRLKYLLCLAALFMLTASCKPGAPTSVIVEFLRRSPQLQVDQIELDIFSQNGTEQKAKKLPDPQSASALTFPQTVVLFPPTAISGELRLQARAAYKGMVVGEGTARLALQLDKQLRVTLTIENGRLVDRDKDGVVDDIDNCPDVANAEQKACGNDGGVSATDQQLSDQATSQNDGAPSDSAAINDALVDQSKPPTDGPIIKADQKSDTAVCTCPLGCKSPGVCYKLQPANGYTATSTSAITTISTAVTINTTDCTSSLSGLNGQIRVGTGGKSACVMAFSALSITTAGSLTATGTYPLVLLVTGNLSVAGVIDVGARGITAGPGGSSGGQGQSDGVGQNGAGSGGGRVCTCDNHESDDCGGGGAGHGQAGNTGGTEGAGCGTASTGGVNYGADLLPLTAGSGGSSGGNILGQLPACMGRGGAGGGALQISVGGNFTLSGSINAGGGGGRQGVPVAPVASAGGGGGGSGGGVLIEATTISGAGIIATNGGGGGAGADTGNNPPCGSPQPGADGTAALTAAIGGNVTNGCGRGGNGGAGGITPQAGGVAASYFAGGGGGGGVGRIHLRWRNHTATVPVKTSGIVTLSDPDLQ